MTKFQGGPSYFGGDAVSPPAYGWASMRIKLYCEAWKERQPFRIIEVTLFPKVGEILELGRRERVEVLQVERVLDDRRLDAIVHVKEVN